MRSMVASPVHPLAASVALVAAVATAAACGAAPAASTEPIAWRILDPDPAGEAGPLGAILADGRYVGVGSDRAWISDDGLAWRGTPLPDAGDVAGKALVMVDGRYLAVGSGANNLAVWTSDDATSWRRAPHDPDLAAEPGFGSVDVMRVAVGEHGLVAVGTEWGGAGQRPAAWWSADGIDWMRAENSPTGSGSRDVAALGDGFVMAVADNARAGAMTGAAFWWSDDGRSWSAAGTDASFANAEPQTLAVREGTVVAAGFRLAQGGFAPAVWVSPDGRAWDSVPASAALSWWPAALPTPVQDQGALQGTLILNVAAGPRGFTAVGVHAGLDPNQERPGDTFAMVWRAAVWRSPNGRDWELLPDDPVFALGESGSFRFGPSSVLDLGDRVLAFGTTPQFGATVWEGASPAD